MMKVLLDKECNALNVGDRIPYKIINGAKCS